MNKKLIIRVAVGATVLAGTGFGIYKLYQKKQEPKEVIDISEPAKEPEPEEEPEAPAIEVEAEDVEEPESDEDEGEDDYVETDEEDYDHYYNKWR